MRLIFLAEKEGELQPMMRFTGSFEKGCLRFNRLSGYEIFWVIVDDQPMQKAVPYGDAEWRLTDDSTPHI